MVRHDSHSHDVTRAASKPVLPGATVGILGGGQLGRMLAVAARQMGYRVHVFAPESEPPAAAVADRHMRASFDDLEALGRFATEVDVVTFEFENIPAESVAQLAARVPVHPSGSVLHRTQNRVREKQSIRALGIPVVDFAEVNDRNSLRQGIIDVGTPAILKTVSWGYDGKGQRRIENAQDADPAWQELGRSPAILEAFAPFEKEISVIGARSENGSVAIYEPFENDHANHVLDVAVCPAGVAEAVRDSGLEIAHTLLEAWQVVGVMCIEMFVLGDGTLLVNEIAPRPHNSGHLTIEACRCSQFEQQLRAVCGLPLGSTALRSPAAMVNLLGDLWSRGEPNFAAALNQPAALHLYGKGEARPGRKMGHITSCAASATEAREVALTCRRKLQS